MERSKLISKGLLNLGWILPNTLYSVLWAIKLSFELNKRPWQFPFKGEHKIKSINIGTLSRVMNFYGFKR